MGIVRQVDGEGVPRLVGGGTFDRADGARFVLARRRDRHSTSSNSRFAYGSIARLPERFLAECFNALHCATYNLLRVRLSSGVRPSVPRDVRLGEFQIHSTG